MTEAEKSQFITRFNVLDEFFIFGYLWNLNNHDYGGPLQFSQMEMHILLYINEHEDCIISDISTYFNATLSAASKIVTRLVRKGVVEKRPVPGNKKNINLVVTELGEQCLASHENYDQVYYGYQLDELLKTFTEEEVSTFFTVMDGLMTSIREG